MNRITQTTLYLLPAFGFDQKLLLKLGFINCFLQDSEGTIPLDKYPVYFLFKVPKDQELAFGEFEVNHAHMILDTYDLENQYLVLIFQYPEKYREDYNYFLQSRYTLFTKKFRKLFKQEIGPVEKKYSKSTATRSLAWSVINRHPDIISFREEQFGVTFTPDMELVPLLDISKETLVIKDAKVELC